MISDEFRPIHSQYERHVWKKTVFSVICIIVTFVAIILSVTIGTYPISFMEAYQIIIDHMLGNPVDETKLHIVWNMRLPRTLMAVAVGAGLAIGGAAMQSMMRNPLADPYTTGVASGASLGATISIILGVCLIPWLHGEAAIVVNAFFISLIPILLIIFISKKRNTTPTMMILAGISVMFIFSATSSLLMLMADSSSLAEVYRWNVGTLGKATWDNIPIVIAVVIVGMIVLGLMSKTLNALSIGDKGSMSLGIDPTKTRLVCMIVIAIMTSTIVSFTGTIGFVGLVCPHVVRIFAGSDNRYLLPCSAAFGAMFLVCADSAAKIVSSTGLPVGIITALVGGPIFLILLIKMNKRVWK